MRFTKSELRHCALGTVLITLVVGMASLFTQGFASFVAHGPIMKGHEDIQCTGCHTRGDGGMRQQVQANLAYALGKRSHSVNYGFQPVTSVQCLECHSRPNEKHPVYRFNEPRFAEVRQQLAANSCLGCHIEHTGVRVSVGETFCSHCHSDLSLENDPLDVSHDFLVSEERWSSCLGCHDFHGNHQRTAQTRVANAFHVDVVRDYLRNGADPFGSHKTYEAKAGD